MAGVVTLQIGQCGAQIGHQLLENLFEDATCGPGKQWKDYCETLLETFFDVAEGGKAAARSVMVDMEPKAVRGALQATRKKRWGYDEGQHHIGRSGSGNNWSYGFCVHGPRCGDHVMNLIRKEVEKCDLFSGFHLMMSLAGGTGSGLGSFISETLCDMYPRHPTLSSVVVPYTSGEVAVQNYNAILSLSHLAATNDATMLIHNDHLYDVSSQLTGAEHVSFGSMNSIAALNLAAIFAPVPPQSAKGFIRHRNVLQQILKCTASHSQYKFLTLKFIPHVSDASRAFNAFTWDGLMKRMVRMVVAGRHMEEGLDWKTTFSAASPGGPRFLSNLLIMRGKDAADYDCRPIFDITKAHLYPRWVMEESRCSLWRVNRPLLANEKSICSVSNGSNCVGRVRAMEAKARYMFASRAYLHHYAKHGLEEEDFINSFATVQNVIKAYENL